MDLRFLLTIITMCAFSVAGLAHASEADDAEAIRQTNNLYAETLVAGNVDALMTLYDDSAILFPPNESPLHGKAAISASWEAFPCGGVSFCLVRTSAVGRKRPFISLRFW